MALDYDALVIGAGPAGLLVCEKLHACGYRVAAIEAGPATYPNPSLLPGQEESASAFRRHSTLEDSDDWRYRFCGAKAWWPRAIALGGRGNLWGGWLARFAPQVFMDGVWPYTASTLAPAYRVAEQWLNPVSDTLAPHFRRMGRALGVTVRPGVFATRIGANMHQTVPGLVICNTVVERIELDIDRTQLHLRQQQRTSMLTARAVVVATSPVETTRLLMNSGVVHPSLGKRLTDHHMLGYLLYEPERAAQLLPGPIRLPTATIRTSIAKSQSCAKADRYTVELLGPVPTQLLRSEHRRLLDLGASAGGSVTYITAIGEQLEHSERYIDLAPRAKDGLGRPVPQVHLAWSGSDQRIVEEMRATCRAVAETLASPGAELVRCGDPFVRPALYHPAGTCAMGIHDAAACDAWGRLRQAPNLWVADASVFPSSGDTHPTLTVLAHAVRVAASVGQRLAR